MEEQDKFIIELTTKIASAYVENNSITADQVPPLLQSVFQTMSNLAMEKKIFENLKPAVSIETSVLEYRLTCLECGKTFKSIKRHLKTSHDLSSVQYREKWGLKSNYPMVAPQYAKVRSQLAKNTGFGKSQAT